MDPRGLGAREPGQDGRSGELPPRGGRSTGLLQLDGRSAATRPTAVTGCKQAAYNQGR